MNKILLLLVGMLSPALGFAQGNRNYQQTSLDSSGHTLAGTTVDGCTKGAVGYSCALVDSRWAAPSLNVDATNYGLRTVNPFVAPAIAGITASINSGSSTASLSAASTFQDGDGVVIYGAGATNTMSTPAAPTVTPSVSASYTGSLLDVAAPAGGTQYCYQVVARDAMGGLTAASNETCTSTGATTLGSRTNSVSAITMANNVVTVTTSVPHGLAVGALVVISGVTVTNPPTGPASANPFNGWFVVAGSADNTHFTYNTNFDTRADSPAAGASGTITYWQDNHITWTAVKGAFEYYIYGRVTGRTKTLIGVSWPQDANVAGDTTYLAFDDFGGIVTTYTRPPNYVPNTPPVAATNDMLSTTISSGAGTTTLSLAMTAGNTATNATVLFDDAINFLTAANAANASGTSVLIPTGNYVFNAPITISIGTPVIQRGTVTFNETVTMSGVSWTGEIETGTLPSFAYSTSPTMNIGRANPGIFTVGSANLYNLTINNLGTNGTNMIVMDAFSAIPAGTFKDINFILNNGGTDYMDMALVTRGTHTASGAVWNFDNILISTSQNGNLLASTPAIYFDNGANPKFNNLFMSGKGVLLRPTVSGSYLEADTIYSQGNYEPFFAFTNFAGNGNASVNASIKNAVADTTFAPIVANLGGGFGTLALTLQIEGTGGARELVTGGKTSVAATNSFPLTQPTALENSTQYAYVNDGAFGRTSIGLKTLNSSMAIGRGYSIFTGGTTPAAPTCNVTAGGAVPQPNTFFYYYAPVFVNGSEGKFSIGCSATTSSGNQTIAITWTAVPGAIGYNLYRGPSASNVVRLSCSTIATTTISYTDTAASHCADSVTNAAAGGPAGIQNDTVWASNLTLGPSAAPTGVTNQVKFYMDSTLNWPSFKPNGNTGYALLGFNGGISPSVQTKRVSGCATIASMNATCDTTVTWPNAFGDTSYTAVCSGEGVSSGVPIIQGIDISTAKTASSISVRTLAITTAAAHFTSIDCTAVHD